LTREGAARAKYLDAQCGDDTALRREVDSLLVAAGLEWNLMDAVSRRAPRAEAGETGHDDIEKRIGHEPLSKVRRGTTVSAGTRLGPYEVLSPLGAGGMGEVYRARDPRLGREVAIKVLPASLSKDADRLRRFEQEARAAGVLNHPNITAVYDVGEQDGNPYVVQELLQGQTLRSELAGGRLSPQQAIDHAVQIAHGLAAAHEKGIIHRDLKPENLFVNQDGRLKILDFGLAKLVETPGPEGLSEMPTAEPETAPGMILGTIGYMAPEQVRGKSADARSDIFAFGAILYEMLSGRRAFHGDTPADTLSAILTKDVPELSATDRQVSPALDRVVRHCLEKDPERRFRSAHDLAFDLEALSEARGVRFAAASSVRNPRRYVFPVIAVAILIGATLLWRRSAARHPAFDSIAVLPFANASRDPATEYLSDGITESIINSLSKLREVRVAARSSAFRYKGRDADSQTAGRELNVRAVVTGRVIQRGDTLLVQADLVDVSNGAQIWGEHYDRRLADVLAVQEEIAKEISDRLRLRLTGAEEAALRKRPTRSAEAYQLYLKGRYAWEKRTPSGLREAAEYFQQAIEMDPAFALAYSGLAESYAVRPSYSVMAPAEAFSRARAAARKAVEIDDDLAAAHAALGMVYFEYDYDWPAAERELRKSIELDPNYVTAHFWYQLMLTALGRPEEALAQSQRAREIDPFSAIIRANALGSLTCARRFDRAIEEGRKLVQESPNFAPAHFLLGRAYEADGMRREAAAEFHRSAELFGPIPQGIYHRGRAFAAEGRRAEVLAAIEELKEQMTHSYVPPASVAILLTTLGDKEQAFDWLGRACEDRSYDVLYLNVDPVFDALRNDPRFAALTRKVNLPETKH
jgi:serine/threonine protein kinase/tetratricopeptide (TPR) repeat protein